MSKDVAVSLALCSSYDIEIRRLNIVVGGQTYVVPFDESMQENFRLLMRHIFSLLDEMLSRK